jgi:hypothetical protein
MPSGRECHGYALKGGPFCYFHTRLHLAARKPISATDSIEIPVLEDRCAIQVTITQVLRAIVNNTIDRPRASLLLYGLQLSLQSVDRNNWAIPFGTVEALSQTSDGDELAADPDDDDEDEDDEEEEDSDSDESDDEADAEDDEAGDSDDDDDDENDDDGLDNRTTEELIGDLKYLDSIRRQAGLDP